MKLLKGHDHDVERWTGICKCDACDDRSFNHGLRCNYCDFTVHNKCTFVFSTLETFEHTSHVGHCLKLLTTGAPDHTDPKCHICGDNTQRLLYHCSICKLNLDIDCMIEDMWDRAHLNMPWHHHPLLKLDFGYQMLCKVCGHPDGYGYFCPRCKLMVHEKCASIFDSPVITHPFHARHSLKLLTKGAPDYTDPKCHVCRRNTETFLYHCDICKFNLDMVCAIEYHDQHKPTPVALSNLKVHEHTVTLIPRLISFVCNACGTEGDRSPYVSLHEGDLMFFHQECAHLPRVINVNRHDHRVSYTYPLGPGEWKCGICLEEIDWSYGAYSCSLCPNYGLHSRCATRQDVWDGKDLDGVPEEIEDIEPFKRNEDNTITHFAHKQHKMSINNDVALVESILCEACVRPIASNTFYSCSDCSFVLHETCANLLKKKRHFLSPGRLTLRLNRDKISCMACLQMCCKGFMYSDEEGSCYDLLCSSIAMPFIHESHPHPLLYLKKEHIRDWKLCQSCGITNMTAVLGCIKCKYFLDFRCATLPLTARLHNYDAHPLTLCYGEKASGKYWCDICERETNPETWFYTCNDCGVTLHIFCVLGNVRYAKPGGMIFAPGGKFGGKFGDEVELMFNNTSSRPLCNTCRCRCAAPFFLVKKNDFFLLPIKNELFCSYYCLLRNHNRASDIASNIIRPPWYEPLALDW